MAQERFAFDFDRRFVVLLACLGVRRDNSEVVLDDETLDVRFGFFRLTTPVHNLRDVRVTRDYRWFKAIGARGSFVDRGATFGTNARIGVCVRFHEPVAGIAGDRMLHPGLTVTVEQPDEFAQAVRRRIESATHG